MVSSIVAALRMLLGRRKLKLLRVFAMGVQEEYRARGVDALFYYETVKRAIQAGYTVGEASWILANNDMMNRAIEMMGAEVYKTYRIYEKQLLMASEQAQHSGGAPPPQADSVSPATIKTLLANRNFAALFIGQTMSQAGDQFVLIAALHLINQLLDSQIALAGIALALSLPRLPLSLLAGVVVDRWSRKRMMILTDVLRGLVVLTPLLINGPADIWILYLAAISLGVLTPFSSRRATP